MDLSGLFSPDGGNMSVMAAEKETRGRGRPANRTPTVTIHTAIEERVGNALRAYMDSKPDGAKLKKVTERAYILLLTEEGFWPPADEPKKKNGHKAD